jgi:sugar lactone lactonase YvrE
VIDGTLYYAEYGAHVVTRYDGTATEVLWTMDGCGPSAVIPFQGDMLVTCYDSNQIARITMAGETAGLIDADADGAPFVGPNDFAEDGKGGAYMTASGPWESAPIVGKVYHIDAGGAAQMVADDLHYANGLVMSDDGSRLYVNESEAGRVISFAVGADGLLSDRRLFVRVGQADEGSGAGAYPDGIKLGPDGNLYVGQFSSGRIVVVNPAGELVRVIEVPSPAAPNLAFAPDGKAIYVMAVDNVSEAPYRGSVYKVDLE